MKKDKKDKLEMKVIKVLKDKKVYKVLMVQLEYKGLEVILVPAVMWEMMVLKEKKVNKV